jgi:geranylgeranyl pyrophosphate synthase
VIDARGIERGRPPLDIVDLIAEAEQIFGQIGAILAGDAVISATRFGF